MSIFSTIRQHSVVATVVTIGAVVIVTIGTRAAHKAPTTNANTTTKQVTLVDASTFRNGSVTVAANGTVEAHSQADLKSQASAPVSVINAQIGSYVTAGQVILELENADIRAQLAQARASLALAQGQQYTGSVSVDSAKQGAIDKIRDAYLKSYDAVYADVDPILYNGAGSGSQLTSYVTDSTLTSRIIRERVDLVTALRTWKTVSDSLSTKSSNADIQAAIAQSQANMKAVDALLADVSQGLSDAARSAPTAVANTLSTSQGIVSGARTTVSSAVSALTTASASLDSSSASQGTTVNAQVSVAQAGVANLEAQLAKTVITSPISGTVSALPLRVGELASPGTLLATVVGKGGLQIRSFVSGEDLARIKQGAVVSIGDNAKGYVSRVAPSVSATNKKAEVDIEINNPSVSGLVVGQNVTASIAAAADSASTTYLVPIQNVKIIPGSAYVLTVDENSKIKRNEVTLGTVQGDFIEVVSGMNDTMKIVSPVYELDEGETVNAQ